MGEIFKLYVGSFVQTAHKVRDWTVLKRHVYNKVNGLEKEADEMKNYEEWKTARQELTFVDKLTEEEKQFLEDNVAEVSYRKGFNIYSMDCDCPGVLLIKSGWVRVYMLSRDGREITLYRMGPGEVCVISAACCLGGMTFEAHIDAETDMEAWLIPSSAYRRLKEQNIYVENFTYEKTVEKFRDVMWVMEQILFMSLEERIAIFLMDETERRKSMELKVTQEQIARYIGSAREAVSRVLKEFQKDRIIEQSRGILRVLDMKKLRGKI